MEEPKIEVGEFTVDTPDLENISFVPADLGVTSVSEMSDEQLLETEEGRETLKTFKEEVTGEEKKEREGGPAKETPPAKKEGGEKETKPAETKEEKVEKTDKQEKYSKDVQKRINKITFEKHEAARRADHAEAKLKERDEEIRKVTNEKAKAEIANTKPNEIDFESEAEYYEALGRWSTRSELLEIESERTIKPTTDISPAPNVELPPEVQAMLKMGSETYDDFDAAVEQSRTLPQLLVEEAMETKEKAHDIIYYLAKNQDEAVRIAGLSPKAITREIGKIEAGLSAPLEKAPATEDISEVSNISTGKPQTLKPKQTTNAPPPITPIKPGATTTTPDQNDMTNKEYRASRGFTSDSMKKSG